MQTPQQPTTFHYQDLTVEVDPDVYDPAEDTFLLLQTIHPQPGASVLELGTGCGIIALACARNGASVVASDINPHAVRNCRRNLKRNQPRLTGNLDVRHGDLFSVPPTRRTIRPHRLQPTLRTHASRGDHGGLAGPRHKRRRRRPASHDAIPHRRPRLPYTHGTRIHHRQLPFPASNSPTMLQRTSVEGDHRRHTTIRGRRDFLLPPHSDRLKTQGLVTRIPMRSLNNA